MSGLVDGIHNLVNLLYVQELMPWNNFASFVTIVTAAVLGKLLYKKRNYALALD